MDLSADSFVIGTADFGLAPSSTSQQAACLVCADGNWTLSSTKLGANIKLEEQFGSKQLLQISFHFMGGDFFPTSPLADKGAPLAHLCHILLKLV